jgi:hypothetical protein
LEVVERKKRTKVSKNIVSELGKRKLFQILMIMEVRLKSPLTKKRRC